MTNTEVPLSPILEKPEPPEEWECCGSECGDACIQEIYRKELRAYEAQQKALKEKAAETKSD